MHASCSSAVIDINGIRCSAYIGFAFLGIYTSYTSHRVNLSRSCSFVFLPGLSQVIVIEFAGIRYILPFPPTLTTTTHASESFLSQKVRNTNIRPSLKPLKSTNMSRYTTFELESTPSPSASSSAPSSPQKSSPIEMAHNHSHTTINSSTGASYFNPDDFWVCCCRAMKERKLSVCIVTILCVVENVGCLLISVSVAQ